MSDIQLDPPRRQADAAELRKWAEEKVRAMDLPSLARQTPQETAHQLQELQTHQIELELQNEELRRLQAELDTARARYADLYDRAPVGYVTLSAQGLILEANLTAASLLDVARDALVKQPFSQFICPEDQARYYSQRKQLLATGTPQAWELQLVKGDGTVFWAQLAATVAQDPATPSAGPAPGGAPVAHVVLSDITERKRAEAALLESSAQFHTLFEASPDAIVLIDPHGRWPILDCNTAACQMNGYTRAELVGQSVDVLNLTPGVPAERAAYLAGIRQGGVLRLETLHRRKDGTVFPVEVSTSLIALGGRDVVLGIDRDITARKQAEATLRELNATLEQRVAERTAQLTAANAALEHEISVRQRTETAWQDSARTLIALIERSPAGIVLCDAQGRIVERNPAQAEFTGLAYDQVVGRPLVEAIGGLLPANGTQHQVQEGIGAAFGAMLQGRQVPRTLMARDTEIQRADGERRVVRIVPFPIQTEQGIHIGIITHDETARVQAEQALQVQRDFAMQILNTVGQGITVTDAAGRFEFVNPAYARFFGYTAADLIGKRPREITAPGDHETLAQQSAARHAGQTTMYETRLLRADGSFAHVLITAAPRASAGPYAGAIAVITDLTERKQAEETLRIQHDLSLALGSCDDLHQALELILAAALQLESLDCGGIYLVDPRGALDLVVHRGLTPQFIEQAMHYPAAAPQARLVRDGRPRYGMDQSIHPELDAAYAQEGLRALAVIPVVHQGQLLAVLNLASHTHAETPVNTRRVLETLAQQISSTLLHLRAAAALRESRLNLQTLFDSVDVFLFVLDGAGHILQTNAVVRDRLGYTTAELAGQDVLAMHPPDRRAEAGAIVAAMLAGQRDFCPVPLQAKDGTLIPVETRVTSGTWSGQPALFGLSRDISERLRAEAALQASEERFRRLAENAPDVIYRLRLAPTPSLEFISPAVTALTGYPPATFYADLRVALTLIHPDDLRFLQAALTGQMTLTPDAEIMRLIARDGTRHWVEQRAVLIHDAAGQLYAIEGIVRDITERKQHEADMQLRAQLLDAAGDSIFLLDLQGQITYANQAAWVSRGYTRAELLQFNLRDLDATEEHAQIGARIAALRQEGALRFEAQHCRKDGSIFPVDVRAQLIHVDGVPMLLEAITDSTQQRLAQEEIGRALAKERELSDLKSQFISTTSHEFRTPLSTILTSAELIEHYGARWPVAKQHYYLRLIQQSCLQMTEMLDDILMISRAEAGKLTCNPAPLDPVALCHTLVEEVRLIASDKHVVTFSHAGACSPARLDERLLRQILANLLSNAVKYSPDGGDVRLELTCTPDQVEFRVQDHGLGIPPEAQPQLFDLFYRAANIGTIRGTGLGLAIVKRAVEVQGGTIQYTSAVGVGTTFVVTLPLAAE